MVEKVKFACVKNVFLLVYDFFFPSQAYYNQARCITVKVEL